jgi:hypothetical protein
MTSNRERVNAMLTGVIMGVWRAVENCDMQESTAQAIACGIESELNAEVLRKEVARETRLDRMVQQNDDLIRNSDAQVQNTARIADALERVAAAGGLGR